MNPVWLAFWVGTFLGAVMGILVIACCVIARREDDSAKMEERQGECHGRREERHNIRE